MVRDSTLTSIEFSKASLSGIGLSRVCAGCPKLTKMLLTCEDNSEVTNEDVLSLVKCKKLESLSLERWTDVTDASITILISLSCLKEINLSHCSGLTSGGVQSLLRSNRNLEVIILSGYTSFNNCQFCDDDLLSCIGECSPKLREFAVDIDPKSTVVSEASFITLFKGCPMLEKLSLCYEKLSDAILIQIGDCTGLQVLKVYHGCYTDAGIMAVASKCTELTSLRLREPLGLSDQTLVCIAENCWKLEVIQIDNGTKFTDRGLCQLFKACTELVNVTLSYSLLITDRSILTLIQSCPKLSELTLTNNKGLTEKSVLELVVGFEGKGEIEVIKFEKCPYLTDETVALMARHCCKLRMITLSDCPLITAKSLLALLTHGKRLTQIEIRNCNVELTSAWTGAHLARRPSLRRIEVNLGRLGTFVL